MQPIPNSRFLPPIGRRREDCFWGRCVAATGAGAKFLHEIMSPEISTRLGAITSAMQITLYGIRNCDTVKKARAWLDGHRIAYEFHDYKTVGIERECLERWCAELGWERVLNRAGTTFRKLSDADKAGLNEHKAVTLMLAQPSMIKRPLLDLGKSRLAGFKLEAYQAAFGKLR